MMHISPCAWYCFTLQDEEPAWDVQDLDQRTLITSPDKSCSIEVAAAHRTGKSEEGEVADIHEKYLLDEGIQPVKTVMTENPFQIVTYVTQGVGADEREHIVCHAYWKNYCAFIKYLGRREGGGRQRVQAFYDLIQSLQPLISG